MKDATDTEIAVRLGMTLGCSKLIILGATGGRLDHFWANVQTLMISHKAGIYAEILDTQNRIRLIGGETHIRREDMYGPYFSVFPLGEIIYGFNITGAKYPLRDHTLTPYDSLCVSNEIAEGEDEAVIDYSGGTRDTDGDERSINNKSKKTMQTDEMAKWSKMHSLLLCTEWGNVENI